MLRHPTIPLLTLVGLLITVSLGAAHDLYIKMDSYVLAPNAPVRVPIINGTFQGSENSITEDRVANVSLVHESGRRDLGTDGWEAEGDTTFYPIRTGGPGTYVLGVSTLPRDLELGAADFNQYLAHDGVVDVLVQRALEKELDTDVRERYSKHVKAIFQVGERRSGGLDVVLGYPAELVPITNPYQLRVGGEMAVRATVDGNPVPGQLVLAGGDSGHGPVLIREARTDANGEVRVALDEPGRWYIKFIHMAKTTAPEIDYESKWATLTFEVR